MARPIILAVDDDASVLEAVVQDLRRKYGQTYRILRAGSGQAALDTCAQLKERGDVVALIVSDQRMPGMSGVELLEKVQECYPQARRVLLTAYADTEAAIRAINSARIHYYLTKPWDPPEERLYPVLDDLLEEWNQGFKPPFEGIRVVGPRYGLQDYRVRNFLSRNQVPYVWLDPERDDQAVELLGKFGVDDSKLPVVLFPDGTSLVQPGEEELAQRVGLRTQAKQDFYDLVVAGAGMAGLAAAVYGASEGLKTLVLEPEAPGGQAGSSSRIENYLGFPRGVTGERLARDAYDQARKFGAEFVTQRAATIAGDGQYRQVRLGNGAEVSCRVGLIAVGVCYRRIEAPGIERLTGSGVYYGASLAEAQSCKDEDCVCGGGSQFGGAGGDEFRAGGQTGDDAGAGGIAGEEYVEISHRSDRWNIEYKGGDAERDRGSDGRRAPGVPENQELKGRRNAACFVDVPVHRGGSADRLAAGESDARSERVCAFGARSAGGRAAAEDVERGS